MGLACRARYEENYLNEKMAEAQCGAKQDGFVSVADTQIEVNSVKQTSKRCSPTSPCTPPRHKSPRTDVLSSNTQTPDAGERHSVTDKQEMQTENMEGPTSPTLSSTTRRKSWRRATMTRRSFPALPNQYQVLCRSISTSLSTQKRLEKLIEASMKLAIERTQNLLQSVPKASLESFHKQVKHMQKECACLSESISIEPPASAASSSDPSVQGAMEKLSKAINRLQAESECWEALLNKHRTKAEELERKVEQGLERGVSLDSTSVAQSSQYHFIQNKPDYHSLLGRQRPMLHTMAMILDTQSKMVKELLFFKEQSQLLVKETSGRLATEAGFQDLPSDLVRRLMATPLSSATT